MAAKAEGISLRTSISLRQEQEQRITTGCGIGVCQNPETCDVFWIPLRENQKHGGCLAPVPWPSPAKPHWDQGRLACGGSTRPAMGKAGKTREPKRAMVGPLPPPFWQSSKALTPLGRLSPTSLLTSPRSLVVKEAGFHCLALFNLNSLSCPTNANEKASSGLQVRLWESMATEIAGPVIRP